ncbi:TOMM precursor leader peptide-binding protein [Nonomuraea sp. NPDC046570]|uniref:TOMM precursor leader peptide-binding protein n=1 Tax=Nonomuraea sp. NPDC046570 TaxID=3155255 RepID=UPI0033D3062B
MYDRFVVGVAGADGLGHAVADRLQRDVDVDWLRAGAAAPAGLSAVVTVGDTQPPPGLPWLPVRVELGTAFIGPATLPGTPGCPDCVASRRDKAVANATELRAARDRFADGFAAPEIRLTRFAVDAVTELAADELARLLRGEPRTRNAVIHVELDTLSTGVHRFLPEPACLRCGGLPDDDPEAARVRLTPHPKATPVTYRVRDLHREADALLDVYVDPESGLIRTLQRTIYGTYPTTSAPIAMSPTQTETGFGRDLDYRTAQITAVTEAVERYGGGRPGGRRTVVKGSYRELADRALDPKTLGLYSDERYAQPGFPFERYHDDLVIPWVWGHSFARDEPILVPECCVYYRMHLVDHSYRPFVYEISNGCALGGCLEEAILYGILELAERDAFLMTWYGRLPVRELDLSSATDPTVPLMVERFRQTCGYEVRAFDTTMEHGIPSVWVMAVNPDAETDAKAFCAAASGFVPERAIANALLELAPMVEWRSETTDEDRARAARMVENPGDVREMHDHALVNAHPDAFPRYGFLFRDEKPHTIEDSYAGAFLPRHDDLTDDLTATVARFLERGQDVVVVDQTMPEHTAGGFRCVKVLIPGLLPMTFGHWARRTDGLPRLLEVPHLLGYRAAPLRPDEINPHPHPFP